MDVSALGISAMDFSATEKITWYYFRIPGHLQEELDFVTRLRSGGLRHSILLLPFKIISLILNQHSKKWQS